MNNSGENYPLIVLLVAAVSVLSLLCKPPLKRFRVPSSVAYILLGFLLGLLDVPLGFLSETGHRVFEFLATVGVFTLLFRIGLESDLGALLGQLRRAKYVWMGDVAVSGGIGFAATHFLLGQPLVTSLFVATALTATSVGVTVSAWESANALKSSTGELLIDVAEMDDISGVLLMGLLFSLAPRLLGGVEGSVAVDLAKTAAIFLVSMAAFGLVCFLFSRYVEERLTKFFKRFEDPPDPMLLVVGTGIIIAALAGLLGFSVAIGAFFAGVAFSRDPNAVKMEPSFESLYDFFMPFFFVGIGLRIDPASLETGLAIGGVLLLAAALGQLAGAGGPTLALAGWSSAALIGISMIPRAEIALVVMKKGLSLGQEAVSDSVYAAVVLVSVMTCIASPLIVHALLRKWPQRKESEA
jgi:Kef-type K+ transport system membrane component KefB